MALSLLQLGKISSYKHPQKIRSCDQRRGQG